MLLDLIKQNRSYRSFNKSRAVSEEELRSLVECARFSASGNNRQMLRFLLCADAEKMGKVFPHLKWAAALPEWHLPPAGHEPPAAIVLCHDKTAAEDPRVSARDVGIAAQSILLAAVEMGLGGCMIANFIADDLAASLALPEHLTPVLVIALGKPDETVILEDLPADGKTAYYRDENGVHHVPKRTMDELIVQ